MVIGNYRMGTGELPGLPAQVALRWVMGDAVKIVEWLPGPDSNQRPTG
jgi:hypothetical protein